MHYMNGRVAHNGDKIVHVAPHDKRPTAGILYNATAGNDYCNGMCAPLAGGNHFCPNLKECVHFDDFVAGQPAEYPDTSSVSTGA